MILGAAKITFFPILFSLISIALQLHHVKKTSVAAYCLDVVIALYALFFGFLMETFFITQQVITYATTNAVYSNFPPGWVFILYPLFALTLNHALNIFNKKPVIAIPCFAAAWQLSYYFGKKMGALQFSIDWQSPDYYFFLAFFWLIFLIILYFLNKHAAKVILSLFDKGNLSQQATLLYDGECPICRREVTHLQHRNSKQLIQFVNIADSEYQKEKYGNLDYMTAMRHIHVIDGKGAVLQGPEAFYQLYVRAGYPLVSLFFKLPLFHALFAGFYYLFARYRLKITGRKQRPPPSG